MTCEGRKFNESCRDSAGPVEELHLGNDLVNDSPFLSLGWSQGRRDWPPPPNREGAPTPSGGGDSLPHGLGPLPLYSLMSEGPGRFHHLRDTHASLLAKARVPIEVISKRLGHSDIGITYDRYITVYRDLDAEAAQAFAKILN